MFLKRAAFGHIQSEDLFLGAILNVYSRQVKIVEYADVFTRNDLEGKKSRTLALVKPDAYQHLGKIISEIYSMNFIISGMRMVKMTKADAEEFFAAEKGQPYFPDLIAHMTSDVVTAMEVVGDSAIHAWQARIGASEETAGNPNTLRAMYGADKYVKNGIHGSKSIMDARNEIEISALQMQSLSTVAAEEFLEVYKGVLPEYHDTVQQMCAGPVIAMEIH